jgi:sensor histidine kinase YesM
LNDADLETGTIAILEESELQRITRQYAVKSILITLLFDTIIAAFLTVIKFGQGFVINFIISQSIGLSICSCILIAHHLFRSAKPTLQAILVAAALIIGTTAGSLIGTLASGMNVSILFDKHGPFFLQLMLLGVMFGTIINYIFTSREQITDTENRIREEQIKRLTSEKEAAEAKLKLLQVQIEPHFLFNTLSNILSLLDTDLDKGKSMLVDFIQYLRTSLPKIREKTTTLGQEMDMIRAYLNIFKIRMGERLLYTIDLPKSVEDFPLPPMLIQPLVENAIKHGLEPKVEGGEILIRGEEKEGILRVEVIDTGLGFSKDKGSGTGLSNIKERLKSSYGNGARLVLEANQPCGVKATIEVTHGRS